MEKLERGMKTNKSIPSKLRNKLCGDKTENKLWCHIDIPKWFMGCSSSI